MSTFYEVFDEGCCRPDCSTYFHIFAVGYSINELFKLDRLPEEIEYVANRDNLVLPTFYCRVATCQFRNGNWHVEICRILRPSVKRELINQLRRKD